MNFNLLEKEGMIETLESGLLIIKPEIIVSKQKGGEVLDFLVPSKDE